MDFYAADAKHPLQQVDLFVDGKFFRTLSSIRPRAGNILHLTLDGYPVDYIIPANASLPLVATGLADSLNAPAISNITKVIAIPHGDRVELRSTSSNRAAESKYFT